MNYMKDAEFQMTKIFGYSEMKTAEIERLIRDGKMNKILDASGEFTIVHEDELRVLVFTSWIGAIHYYYYYDGDRFCHGQQIIDIVKTMRLNWEWDWVSVGDVCCQENLTENRTLHKSIKRIPPGSLLVYDGRLRIYSKSLIDEFKEYSADPVEAVEVFNNETLKWASASSYLSLSGGFDSRVILSSMLKQNIYPTVVTLGGTESTDVKVASQIADRFGLPHIKVRLELEDLLESGERIAYITNGTKPACHWHTYMYPQKANVPQDVSFFVGTLGEFARCYYFDKGMLSLLLDGSKENGQEIFWRLKFDRHTTFMQEEHKYLSPELSMEIDKQGIGRKAKRNARLSGGNLLAGGSRYYLEQRVPNFYSNGIRMYNETSGWRSPFHNKRWLEIIWSLQENWKLGSNWHRLAIKRNFPALLQFPEEKGFRQNRMMEKAPPFYWLPIFQRQKYKSYDLSENWYCDDRIREVILDNKDLLSDIVETNFCDKIIKEHRERRTRTKAISFLLTMLYFKKALRKSV